MPTIGPYRTLTDADGNTFPWYIVPFDKKGRNKAPRTTEHLITDIQSGNYSDIFVFSHGWNNDWKTASKRYESFIQGMTVLRTEHSLPMPNGFKPLLIGIFWPSTSLVLPWERAPKFASGSADLAAAEHDAFTTADDEALSDIVADIDQSKVERFYELVNAENLNEAEGLELAHILNPLLVTSEDDDLDTPDTPEALLEAWSLGEQFSPAHETSTVDDGLSDDVGIAAGPTDTPNAAGLLSKLDPRHALRMTSLWRMKDRAGTVGTNGVGPLLANILTATGTSSVHLIGHSFGGKVVLSATATTLPRNVTSMLLLQPAVSGRCFSNDVDGNGTRGGYRHVLDKVDQPIMTTFSKHDVALAKLFHLAVRRKSDLGEQRVAGSVPSKFAALGGYGPVGIDSELKTIEVKDPNNGYGELGEQNIEVLAIKGDRTISGHGDISNESTWWMLYEQIKKGTN